MAKNSNTDEIIASLQLKIREVIDPLFPEDGKFALLDFPNHSNVGDSAIWLGEIEYFKKVHNAVPSYVSDINYYVEDEFCAALGGKGTIFMHGGGNFGDIWPHHQDFREKILNDFRDFRVIQLPQSIHFDDLENIKRSQEVFNAHPDFHLIVRDQKSLDFVQEHYTCKSYLCPDMAFYIGRIKKPIASPLYDAFCLMRTDKEKVEGGVGEGTVREGLTVQCEDWLHEGSDLFVETRRGTMLLLLFVLGLKALDKNRQRELFYRRMAKRRLDRGVGRLATGKIVITDRLHAHILSILLDIPHIRLDNSYGKISNFAKAWTSDSTISRRADSFAEALKKIGR